jgi:hypothetical protein
MESYSAIKKNETMLLTGKWMELEIMLSEISQVQKAKYLIFFSYVESRPKMMMMLVMMMGHECNRETI